MTRKPPSKPPADVAAAPTLTAPPTETPLPDVGPRKHWPKYTTDEQMVLATFLGAMRADAVDAMQKLIDLSLLAPEHPQWVPHIGYWRNAISCIDWLTSRIPHRQKHLQLLKLLREQYPHGA